jgi:hypothetical protein
MRKQIYIKELLKAYFKLYKDFLSHNTDVKTYIHVFDHTILPILLYGCEIWGYFNTLTARFRNESIPLDTVYSKIGCEQLHIKFCKRVLGVHQKVPILLFYLNWVAFQYIIK